jgi:putative ABC transport system permease protein
MGMRKVLGSQRRQLVFQLLIESIFVSFMAFILALVMVELFLPIYNNIVGKELSVKYFSRWYILPLLVFTTLLIGVLAGSYSSISISSFRILSVLRGRNIKTGKKVWFRSGLVVFQFFIAVVIIISTIVVYNQLNYLQKKELGFNKDNLLIIDRAYGIEKIGQLSFKNELLKNPAITQVSISTTAPGLEGWMGLVMKKDNDPPENLTHFRRLACDSDFLKTFKMELKEGRFFEKGKTTGKNYIVINEAAAKSLGLKHAIGKKLVIPGKSYMNKWNFEIIGVVKDFHFSSMKEKIENLVIYSPNDYFARYITVRIDSRKTPETIKYIEKNWKNYAINQPFNYFFVTDKLEELQKTERKTARVFAIFSILALVIASLGLIGLASFMTDRKTREIGIRKAMGSSSVEIVLMLVAQFTRWILLANVLAWPTAYLIMKNWQNNFAYKPDFPWWSILIASLTTLFISIASVSYQTLSTAYLNPASTIRYE